MLKGLYRWVTRLCRRQPTYYFYHIPKTAGCSLHAALEQCFAPQEVCPAAFIVPALAIPRDQLRQYRLFRGHYYNMLSWIVPQPLTTFTFLRDPIERSLSHYDHIRRKPRHYFHRKVQEQGSLLRFLEDPETRPMIANFQARSLLWNPDPHEITARFTPAELQVRAVERTLECDLLAHLSPEEMLDQARTRLDSFAFVGLTEHFEESLARMFRQFGWGAVPAVPHENANPGRTRQTDLSERERQLLEELTSVDRQLYAHASRRLGLPTSAQASTNDDSNRTGPAAA